MVHWLVPPLLVLTLGISGAARQSTSQRPRAIVVAADGSGDYRSVQAAVDALPQEGGIVRIQPGTYREIVRIAKSHVRLDGSGHGPSDVVIVFNNSHGTVGGTLKSATVSVTGDDFYAQGMTFANDYSLGRKLGEGSQAVALLVRGDRAVLRNVRMLGFQDTLFVGSKSCVSEQGPCAPSRQYFSDCYVEGNVDFIFGDAKAFFRDCEIHVAAHETAFLTAQSRHYPHEPSGFVFERCKITADSGARRVFLGRPWRPYSTVIFRDSDLQARVDPAGWREWLPGETHSLDTAFYAEFHSRGPGADATQRDPHSKQLSKREVRQYSAKEFLSGEDGWAPKKVH